MPTPQVAVQQAQPKVSVDQAKPQVSLVPSQQQAEVQNGGAQKPVVKFESEKPQITVDQAEQPVVHFEQMDQNDQQQAANQQPGNANANAADNPPNQQTTQQSPAPGEQTGNAQQIAVSKLKGMELKGPDGEKDVGKITAVILDGNARPFVIVDQKGQKVAIDVDYMRLKGDQLVLYGVTASAKLPEWKDSDMNSNRVQELSGDKTVSIVALPG
jgi:hypothetical protein